MVLKSAFFPSLGKDADDVAPKCGSGYFCKTNLFRQENGKGTSRTKNAILLFVFRIRAFQKTKMENGAEKMLKLPEQLNGIDLIIGGHSHTKLDQPLIVNRIPIVQTGEFGQFVVVFH